MVTLTVHVSKRVRILSALDLNHRGTVNGLSLYRRMEVALHITIITARPTRGLIIRNTTKKKSEHGLGVRWHVQLAPKFPSLKSRRESERADSVPYEIRALPVPNECGAS